MTHSESRVLRVERSGPLVGRLRPPSDKSLTHRAYMLGAIASGPSMVRTPLRGEDCESTLACLEAMGLGAERSEEGVALRPAADWSSPAGELDCGNSGTTMRLLSGLIASRPISAVLTGDASLRRRPMTRIADPLRAMGAEIEGERPPLRIRGGRLQPITYESPVASAQVKSAILLAGLRASGRTVVLEPAPTRDHTERMLSALGIPVDQGDGVAALEGPAQPTGFEFSVPGDISSAAFFLVAAAMIQGSRLEFHQVGVNPLRTGILDVLTLAGAEAEVRRQWTELGEPVADLEIEASPGLRAFEISGAMVPRLIDEIPILAVLATQCEGTTVIRDAAELRVKESDRIELVARGLRAMGAAVETFADGFAIAGPVSLKGSAIDAELDHRIAMAFAVAGLIADGATEIRGAEAIETSFPGFEEEIRRLLDGS